MDSITLPAEATWPSIAATLLIAVLLSWYMLPTSRDQRSAKELRSESARLVPSLVVPADAVRPRAAPPLKVKAGASLRMGPYSVRRGVPLRWSFFVHDRDVRFSASFLAAGARDSVDIESLDDRRTKGRDGSFTPPRDGAVHFVYDNTFSVLRAKFITMECSVVASLDVGAGPLRVKFTHRQKLRRVTSFIATPAKRIGFIDASAATAKARPVTVDVASLSSDASPLLVFVNSKSGGGEGSAWKREFSRCLHPIQVWDLADRRPPIAALMPFKSLLYAGRKVRLLAVGGDGTCAWVLSLFEHWAQRLQLPLAVLPMGTGNDLSRALGWGPGRVRRDPIALLRAIARAEPVLFDRWRVEIRAPDHAAPRTAGGAGSGAASVGVDPLSAASSAPTATTAASPHARAKKATQRADAARARAAVPRVVVMNNYCGLGCGAKVALHFHRMREKCPALFASRMVNLGWYAKAGFVETLHSAAEAGVFAASTSITVDGRAVDLDPQIQGIIVLNIPSYGAGLDLWHHSADVDVGEAGGSAGGSASSPAAATRAFERRRRLPSLAEASFYVPLHFTRILLTV